MPYNTVAARAARIYVPFRRRAVLLLPVLCAVVRMPPARKALPRSLSTLACIPITAWFTLLPLAARLDWFLAGRAPRRFHARTHALAFHHRYPDCCARNATNIRVPSGLAAAIAPLRWARLRRTIRTAPVSAGLLLRRRFRTLRSAFALHKQFTFLVHGSLCRTAAFLAHHSSFWFGASSFAFSGRTDVRSTCPACAHRLHSASCNSYWNGILPAAAAVFAATRHTFSRATRFAGPRHSRLPHSDYPPRRAVAS